MATEEELNKQNQKLEDQISLQQELNRIIQERVGISSRALSGQQESFNVLQDQLKLVTFEKAERMVILQSLRKTNKIALKNYSILSDELGTTRGLKELAKDKIILDKEILTLQDQQAKFAEIAKEEDIERSRLGKNISDSLKNQISELQETQKELKKVTELSGKIANDFGVKTFGALEDITRKIPGLRKFAEPFQKAAEAARATATDNALEKERVDLKNEAAEAQFESDKAALESGKGLTKDVIKRLGLEKNHEAKQRIADLESLKTGKGLTREKIKELGLEKILISKKGKALTGSYAASVAAAKNAKNMLGGLGAQAAASVKAPLKAVAKTSSAFKAGAKILGKSLSKALGPIGLLLELIMALVRGDKAAGDLAKSMNMTYNEALATRREFTMIAEESGETFVTTKGIQESMIALNKSLGTNVMLNKDNLIFATMMREQMGFSQEAIVGTNKLSEAFGKTIEQITGEVIAQADITATNLGVQLEEKEILEEVSKASAATTLSLKGSGRELAKAVTTAKALGMTLQQIEKISDSILNFEQSISSELKAELLIGRNLNLERARLAAINNDIEGVAREIASQFGSAAEFGDLNRIQQKAIAEAVGMTRDELAETLFTQQAIGNATGEEAKERKAVIAGMLKTMSIEEAQRKLEKEGIENLKKQASTQERFNAMLDKLTEIAVQIGEPLLEIIGPIADLAEFILPKLTGALQPIVGVIKAIFLGIKGIGQAIGALFGNEEAAKSYGDTFSEAGEALMFGFNRGFDTGMGKDSFAAELGLDFGTVAGIGKESTVFGDNSIFTGGANANTNNNNQSSALELDRLRQLNERNYQQQQRDMRELINAVRENRPAVDVFGNEFYGS